MWQTVMPVYSQATATAVADLWRHSTLLQGDTPLPEWKCYSVTSPLRGNATLQKLCEQFPLPAGCAEQNKVGTGEMCAAPSTGGWHPPVSYRFWAGSQSVPVYVRKHDTKEQYLIVASVQPQSNMIGNCPDTVNATIVLAGGNVSFEVRRQGSVYVLDATQGAATLTQIDRWHEASHPLHWSKSMSFEAEVPAQLALNSGAVSARTHTELSPAADHPHDFTGLPTTFVILSSADTMLLDYHFSPRGNELVEYAVWVRARVAAAVYCTLSVAVDGEPTAAGEFGASDDDSAGQFCWSRLQGKVLANPDETHTLSLVLWPQDGNTAVLDVDAMKLVRHEDTSVVFPGTVCQDSRELF